MDDCDINLSSAVNFALLAFLDNKHAIEPDKAEKYSPYFIEEKLKENFKENILKEINLSKAQ